jgi:hypothetical protein
MEEPAEEAPDFELPYLVNASSFRLYGTLFFFFSHRDEIPHRRHTLFIPTVIIVNCASCIGRRPGLAYFFTASVLTALTRPHCCHFQG